jgi:hypothetical protein
MEHDAVPTSGECLLTALRRLLRCARGGIGDAGRNAARAWRAVFDGAARSAPGACKADTLLVAL